VFHSAENEGFIRNHAQETDNKLRIRYYKQKDCRSLVVRLKSTVAHESLGDKNQEDRAFGETSKQLKSIAVRWTKGA